MRRLRATRVSIQARDGRYIELSSDDLRDVLDEGNDLVESGTLDDDNRDGGEDEEDEDEDEDEDDPEPEPDPFGGRLKYIKPVRVTDN